MGILPTRQAGSVSETPQAAQPVETSTPTPAPEQVNGTAQPTGLTTADVERLIAERLEAARREDQRQRDKLEARIQKQYKALETVSAKISGQPLNEAQKADLRNEAIKQVMEGDQEETPPPHAQEDNLETDPLLNDIAEVFDEVGSWVEESDPEAAALLTAMKTGTPRKILAAAEHAAKAKQARLAGGNPTTTPLPTRSPQSAVITGTGQPSVNNPIKDITDPGTLWNMSRKR